MAVTPTPTVTATDDVVVRATREYRTEANQAKRARMDQNQQNWNTYHLQGDYSNKQKGQSREFLPRQALAVEQIVSFFMQGLVDLDDWFSVDSADGMMPTPGAIDPTSCELTPAMAKSLLQFYLDKIGFVPFVGDALKSGLLGSLMISKYDGEYIKKPQFYTEPDPSDPNQKKKILKRKDTLCWIPRASLIRQEDYYPDPTGKGLFELQDIWLDFHEVKALTQGPNAIYDPAILPSLLGGGDAGQDKSREANEKAQLVADGGYRRKVKITECYGSIIDPGTGELLHENVTWAVANDTWTIMKPKAIPFWHGESPIQTAPIVRVPHSVWHRALMDACTRLNISLNEFFNLILDGGIAEVYGIKQIRTDWLEDESEVSDGVRAGQTVKISGTAPVGAKVIERVDTGAISPQATAVYNLTSQELNMSAYTNDMRMGSQPDRQVKATAIVEASNTITGVFSGVVKLIESAWIEPSLKKLFLTILQHITDADSKALQSILGKDLALAILAMEPQDRYAKYWNQFDFNVNGVTRTLNKMKDFRQLTALLQTIGTSEVLIQAFAQKYDFGSLLEDVMRSLDINTDRLKAAKSQNPQPIMPGQPLPGQPMPENGQMPQQPPAGSPKPQGGQGGAAPGQRPMGAGSANPQSQIPQAAAPGGQKTPFPPSPASNA